MIETVSITPDAKPNALLIILSLLLFINMNRYPTNVDIPAIKDKIKAYLLLDILSPVKYMHLIFNIWQASKNMLS